MTKQRIVANHARRKVGSQPHKATGGALPVNAQEIHMLRRERSMLIMRVSRLHESRARLVRLVRAQISRLAIRQCQCGTGARYMSIRLWLYMQFCRLHCWLFGHPQLVPVGKARYVCQSCGAVFDAKEFLP